MHEVGLAADHGERADAAELVNARRPGNIRPIVDVDVSGQHGVVGHDYVIAQVAIVGDVDADHQQAVVADDGRVVGDQGAVNGHVFADGVARADHHPARLGRDVDVLGQPAENDAVEEVVVGAQRGVRCLTTT